mgnify:FL=1|tara:strand:+ start:367 stop:1503 length:1137 start_codon:yes stop_codon:yes gene_type:complete
MSNSKIVVPFTSLKFDDKKRKSKYLNQLSKLLDSGMYISKSKKSSICIFEERLKKYFKKKYCILTSSGSSSLYLALKALNLKKGDEVITSPYTWLITASAIVSAGLKPIFVDIREDYNISPLEIEKKITKKTKVILPIHMAGQMCDMIWINNIAKKHKLFIVEDCAHAFTSSAENKKSGFFSEVASYSMNPMKTFGAFGEAGFVTTNSFEKNKIIKSLLHAGIHLKQKKNMINEADYISLNHKPDELQAAFLNISMDYLNEKLKKLEKISKVYNSELKNFCIFQKNLSKKNVHGNYLYLPRFRNRDKLFSFLASQNIESKVYYCPLLTNSKPFLDKKKYFTNATLFSNEILALPFFSRMSENQLDHVITNIKKFYKNN